MGFWKTRRGLGPLAGRAIAITGAAHGIGRELALQLWSRGCDVALLDHDGDALARLHGDLTARLGHQGASRPPRCSYHVVDVGDAAQMERAAAEVQRAHPMLHGLVNNAGVAHEGPLQDITLATWRRVVDVNLWGVIHGCRVFLPLLARADRGHIVNMSSLFGFVGMAGQAPYCTTKYAVRGLSEALWEELRDTTIGVTVVHPGSVATDIMRRAHSDDPELIAFLADWYERHAFPPARAAACIIAALERGTPRVRMTLDSVVVDLVKRLSPVWGNQLVCALILRVLRLTHMRARRRALWQERMGAPP
jgi:NAD(P)-dependent dehydrogenase (short-subunit alcohol dehydrogenase family)